jgi:hypothetical protein
VSLSTERAHAIFGDKMAEEEAKKSEMITVPKATVRLTRRVPTRVFRRVGAMAFF